MRSCGSVNVPGPADVQKRAFLRLSPLTVLRRVGRIRCAHQTSRSNVTALTTA